VLVTTETWFSAPLEYKRICAKDTVIQGGTKASCLFLVTLGTAKYYRVTKDGKELLVRWLVPGDVFGLATLLKHPPPYMGSVETADECEVYMWKHAALLDLCRVYPQIAQNALRVTLGYLSDYAERHADLLTKSAEQRLAHTLLHLGHRAGRAHATAIRVDVTNEQLGNLADVGLFTASRVLKKWEHKGAVAKERGRILILSPEKLGYD
jgi:CRP/FNR family transcriptional regulator, nitrogen oxide reductase regulator